MESKVAQKFDFDAASVPQGQDVENFMPQPIFLPEPVEEPVPFKYPKFNRHSSFEQRYDDQMWAVQSQIGGGGANRHTSSGALVILILGFFVPCLWIYGAVVYSKNPQTRRIGTACWILQVLQWLVLSLLVFAICIFVIVCLLTGAFQDGFGQPINYAQSVIVDQLAKLFA